VVVWQDEHWVNQSVLLKVGTIPQTMGRGGGCIPKIQQMLKDYFGKEPSKVTSINPDEAVT